MTIEDLLQKLASEVAERGADFASKNQFRSLEPVTEAAIADRERALGVAFPPSYRAFLLERGRFSLGTDGPRPGTFEVWPLAEHDTALANYAAELECEPTAEAVAEEIGMEPEVVEVLSQIVLIGAEGHEDFIGFDLRSRNEETGECSFTLCLRDDTEIEALAEDDPDVCEGRGFDEWLAEHITDRLEE